MIRWLRAIAPLFFLWCCCSFGFILRSRHTPKEINSIITQFKSIKLGALPLTSSPTIWDWNRGDTQYNSRLLCRMIIQNSGGVNTTHEYSYSDFQIDEMIQQRKIDVTQLNEESGLLPMRYSIRTGRRDVLRLLLRHGASALAEDNEGMLMMEALRSTRPGHLHMLTDLLEGVAKRDVDYIFDNCMNSTQKYAVSYWLNRGRSHILPRQKLVQLGIPKLDSLKYRIIGQTFALEQVLGEVASAYANTVLSRKPLVLLFAGPPGHGKSETAKQLADLLQAPFHKVDCRNHAHPWEMFGSGAGYIGSDSGSQLGNFMSQHSNKRNVVLLDEFDHCNAETWEAFYHVFEEGEYVLKKVNGMEAKSVDQAQTRVLDCSRTVWLLTTNVFDNDIVNFNDAHAQSIKQFKKGNYAFDTLQDKFEAYIRPKLRKFFQGGLTRRINSVVPFFCFDEEEAHVVTDMYLDRLREMYCKPATDERKIGEYNFDVTNFAVGELSRAYFKHQLDGASAILREVNNRVVKKIMHMGWVRGEARVVGPDGSTLIHYNEEYGGPFAVGAATSEMLELQPYFLQQPGPQVGISEAVKSISRPVFDDLLTTTWVDPYRADTYQATSTDFIQLENPHQYESASAVAGVITTAADQPSIASAGLDESSSVAVPADLPSSGDLVVVNDHLAMEVNSVSSGFTPVRVEEKFVNVSLMFGDSSEGILFTNLFKENSTMEAVTQTMCAALSIPGETVRLWVKISDHSPPDVRGGIGASRPMEGRRAMVVERTDVIGPWMLVRDMESQVGDALRRRFALGSIPLSECLTLMFELALPNTQYSTGLRWSTDVGLNAWRTELKENDVIDCLIGDAKDDESLKWYEAIVVRVTREYDGENAVVVRVMGENDEVKFRCSSPRIEPLYTKSWDWRPLLRAGDAVQLRITLKQWHLATIAKIEDGIALVRMETNEMFLWRKVHIYSEGIRRYSNDFQQAEKRLVVGADSKQHAPEVTVDTDDSYLSYDDDD